MNASSAHPLHDALEYGFRGVEVDILLRGGELRVGHDAFGTRPGPNLEALYLRPLRAIAEQCGHVLASSTPFLLNAELKESSRAGYDSLLALLERYTERAADWLARLRAAKGAGPGRLVRATTSPSILRYIGCCWRWG